MPINDAFFKWNGVVYAPKDEGPLWKYVGLSALKDAKEAGQKGRVAHLAADFVALKMLSTAYKLGAIRYGSIYDFYNLEVLSRLPLLTVLSYIDNFAQLPETQDDLDKRILRPLMRQRHETGMNTNIVSTGCAGSIRSIMDVRRRRQEQTMSYFDRVVANELSMHGNGTMFDYRKIYTGDEKSVKLMCMLPQTDEAMKQTLFMGDSDTDILSAGMVSYRGGHVASSFHADEEFKEIVGKMQNGHVFESELDFADFLKKA